MPEPKNIYDLTPRELLKKIVNPTILPILLANLWVFSTMMNAGVPFLARIGLYLLATGVPTALAIWYGWDLHKEFKEFDDD